MLKFLWSENLGFNLEKTTDFVLIKKKRVGNQKKTWLKEERLFLILVFPMMFTMMFLRFSMGSLRCSPSS
jgi:hypothetical protein